MKLNLGEAEPVAAIRPVDLLGYLRAKGWREERRDNNAALWSLGGEEALVPLRTEFRDYARRVLETLRTLAVVEDRSELAVFRDVKASSSDVIRVRAVAPDYAGGTMPFEEAVALVERSRDLMLAAACSAVAARPVFHTRKPTDAVEFMKRVRMGQTEIGSFVVTMQAPVPPALQPVQQTLPTVEPGIAEEPFERRCTRTLIRSLHALQGAVEESTSSGSFGPFEAAVAAGVSANLCDTLVDLYESCHAAEIEVAVNWAAVHPHVPAQSEPPPRIVLPREFVEPLKSASRMFREQRPDVGLEVRGYVVKLERNDGDMHGSITLYGPIGGRHRRVRLELWGDDYDRAVDAHKAGLPLRAIGNLAKDGRAWVLREPQALAAIEGEVEE